MCSTAFRYALFQSSLLILFLFRFCRRLNQVHIGDPMSNNGRILCSSCRAFSRHSCLLKSYGWPFSSLTVRSNDHPGAKPAFSAWGTIRGGEYISEILPLAVTVNAEPTLSERMSVFFSKSSTAVSAARFLLPVCTANCRSGLFSHSASTRACCCRPCDHIMIVFGVGCSSF